MESYMEKVRHHLSRALTLDLKAAVYKAKTADWIALEVRRSKSCQVGVDPKIHLYVRLKFLRFTCTGTTKKIP